MNLYVFKAVGDYWIGAVGIIAEDVDDAMECGKSSGDSFASNPWITSRDAAVSDGLLKNVEHSSGTTEVIVQPFWLLEVVLPLDAACPAGPGIVFSEHQMS